MAAAGIAAAELADDVGLTVHVIGTPAEEGGGGKVKLLKAGVFRDVDAAMMIHGWDKWIGHQDLLGICRVGFEFTGKAAHASADPWEGVNALDAWRRYVHNEGCLPSDACAISKPRRLPPNGRAASSCSFTRFRSIALCGTLKSPF